MERKEVRLESARSLAGNYPSTENPMGGFYAPSYKMIIDFKNRVKERQRFSIDENGRYHGSYRCWYSDGKQWHEKNYKHGQYHGSHSYWYNNENYHGVYRSWYLNGNLYKEENYKDGQRHGLSRYWRNDGKLYFERNFKDGKII